MATRMRKVATANLKSLGHAVGVGKRSSTSSKNRSLSIDEGSGAPKTPVLERIARLDIASRSSSFSISDDETETVGSIDEEEEDVDKELELYKTALNEEGNLMKGILPYNDVVEENFEQEERSIVFIKDSMARSQQLNDQMVHILESFEDRLSTLETTIYPIHRLMQNWKLAHENIDKTMLSITKVLDIFDIAAKVEEKITDGTRGDYDAYLACIDQIADAVLFLSNNKNFKSSEKALGQLKTLLKTGLAELENVFKSLIMKHSNPIDPTKLPEKMPERNRYLEIIPTNAMEELKKIVKRFGTFGYTNHLKDYKDRRSKFIVNSMRKLNPEKIAKENNEAKAGYTKGTHKFIEFLRTTLKLFQAERDFGMTLLHQVDTGTTFESVHGEIMEAPLELLEEATETLIKSKHNTADIPALFFGVFVLFDIWEEFNRLVPEFDRAVKVRNGKHNEDIAHLETKLRQVCQKSFSEFEEDIKKDSLKMLPVDATVHELTSNTVNYLKRLIEYKDTVETLLPKPQNNTSSKPYAALREFILGVLAHLKNNLESKAKREKKVTLANIFLLNNYHYMWKTIKTSEITTVLPAKFVDEYEKVFDEQFNTYIETWNKAAELIILKSEEAKNTGKALTSKEKSSVKHRLSGFNAEIEEQFHLQKGFSVPDSDLQAKLRNAAKAKLIPLYTKFVARYGDVQFTKNTGKYLRYSAETLDQMLMRFFEGNAGEGKKSRFKF